MIASFNSALSMTELFKKAESGDMASQNLVGIYHQYGYEFDLPYPEDFMANIESLSEQGLAKAQYMLANIFRFDYVESKSALS